MTVQDSTEQYCISARERLTLLDLQQHASSAAGPYRGYDTAPLACCFVLLLCFLFLSRAYLRCTGGDGDGPCPAKKLVDIDLTVSDGAPRVHYLNSHSHLPPDTGRVPPIHAISIVAEADQGSGSADPHPLQGDHGRTAQQKWSFVGDVDAHVQPGAQAGIQAGVQPGTGSSALAQRQTVSQGLLFDPSWCGDSPKQREEGGGATPRVVTGVPGARDGRFTPRTPPDWGNPPAPAPASAPAPAAAPALVPEAWGGPPATADIRRGSSASALPRADRALPGGTSTHTHEPGGIRPRYAREPGGISPRYTEASPGEVAGRGGRGAEAWGPPPPLGETRGGGTQATSPLGASPGYTGASPGYTGGSPGHPGGSGGVWGDGKDPPGESQLGAPPALGARRGALGAPAGSPRGAFSAGWGALHRAPQNTAPGTLSRALEGTEQGDPGAPVGSPRGAFSAGWGALHRALQSTSQGTLSGALQCTVQGTEQGAPGAPVGSPRGASPEWDALLRALQRTSQGTVLGTEQGRLQGTVQITGQGIVAGRVQGRAQGSVRGLIEGGAASPRIGGGDAGQWAGQGLGERVTGWHRMGQWAGHGRGHSPFSVQGGGAPPGIGDCPPSWQVERPPGADIFEDPLQFLGGRDTLRPSHLLDPPVTGDSTMRRHSPVTGHPPVTSHPPASRQPPFSEKR